MNKFMNELNPLYMFLYLIIKEKPRIGLRSWSLESDAAADVLHFAKKDLFAICDTLYPNKR